MFAIVSSPQSKTDLSVNEHRAECKSIISRLLGKQKGGIAACLGGLVYVLIYSVLFHPADCHHRKPGLEHTGCGTDFGEVNGRRDVPVVTAFPTPNPNILYIRLQSTKCP